MSLCLADSFHECHHLLLHSEVQRKTLANQPLYALKQLYIISREREGRREQMKIDISGYLNILNIVVFSLSNKSDGSTRSSCSSSSPHTMNIVLHTTQKEIVNPGVH